MYDSYFQEIPWQRFMDFISPSADRFTLLKNLIEKFALEHRVIELSGGRHFVVAPSLPSQSKSLSRLPPTIIVAHYDRAEGSPGANDNSAGVFLLIEAAIKLKKKAAGNWLIIFTDREELKPGEGIMVQGSYALAEGLKNLKMENSKIFCFDACGIGDTLIISTTFEYLLKKEGGGEKLRESMMELRQLALNTARNLSMKKVLLVPTPFSDDAGFFRARLAAQTITMLPSEECIQLVSELRKNPEFLDSLIGTGLKKNYRPGSIPETWRSLNSAADSYVRLTPKNFRTVINFAEALCNG